MLIVLLSGTYLLNQNKVVRETIFSNFHVAWLLNFVSIKTPTSAGDFAPLYGSLYDDGNRKSIIDPEKRSQAYWMSVAGWERIKRDPLKYIFIILERVPQVIYPSFYKDGISWRYKLINRSIMFFITLGVTCTLLLSSREKFEMVGLFLMASSIYLIFNFYHSEWDLRVHLSAYVILIPLASLGWVDFFNIFYKRIQLLKSRKTIT